MKVYCLYYIGDNDYEDSVLVGVYSNMDAVKTQLLSDEEEICMIETRILDDVTAYTKEVDYFTRSMPDQWMVDDRFQNREPGTICDSFIKALKL